MDTTSHDTVTTPWTLQLHESYRPDLSLAVTCTRVPGGWIYDDSHREYGMTSVFVPFVSAYTHTTHMELPTV